MTKSKLGVNIFYSHKMKLDYPYVCNSLLRLKFVLACLFCFTEKLVNKDVRDLFYSVEMVHFHN